MPARRLLYGRLVVAVLCGVLAARGSSWVDQGGTHSWSLMARAGWAVALLVALLLGVWAAGTFIGALVDESGEASRTLTAIVVAIGSAGLGLGVLAIALQAWAGIDPERTLMVDAGAVLAGLTWTRPDWFWEHPKAQLLRGLIGDRLTIVVYGLVAAGSICAGIMVVHPGP